MALIEKLFGGKQDPLDERADALVSAAQINAVGSFRPLADKFQFLGDVKLQDWDFFVTVATVFIGATRLSNLRMDEAREDKLMEIVTRRLDEWNKDGVRGFEDCKRFFESGFDQLTQAGHDPRFVAADSVGKWIVWNILGRAPESNEELLLVRSIGAMATHAVFDWWDV